MITNESEIRIALQGVLVSVLMVYGFWGCAVVVLLMMLPWKPILAVGGYLAQPVVDWRIQKARDRQGKLRGPLERDFDALLRVPRTMLDRNPAVTAAKVAAKPPRPASPQRVEPMGAAAVPASPNSPKTAAPVSPVGDVLPAIQDHVRNLPQGVFSNMAVAVEDVTFQGNSAQAYVRFKSPNVNELVIRQCYLLRKAGEHWQVVSRRPAHEGAGVTSKHAGRPSVRIL